MFTLVKIILLVNFFSKIYSFCPVQLTVSLNSLILKDANLVVSWDPKCSEIPTKIRIYSENPYLKKTPVLIEINPKKFETGQIDTEINLKDLKLPSKWDIKTYQDGKSDEVFTTGSDSNCLNYYALSFNNSNHVTNFNCLKVNPEWMTNTKEFWLFPLKHLVIPGTACSGCYATERNVNRKHLSAEDFHQNLDVWHQLVFGIRYLDFSVGYFRSFHNSLDIWGRFWVFNENHEISPIFPILDDILRFVEVSKEIVILDFRKFAYGFHESSGAHDIFKKLLQNMFGHIAMMNNGRGDVKSYDFTIQKMKSVSKYILILYNHDDLIIKTERNETVLWPAWKRSEIQTSENVAKIVCAELSTKYRNDGWILSANYTKGNTDNMNSHIMSALTGLCSNKMNIISLDFAFSTSLIDISLLVNHHKALAKQNFVVIDL